MTKATAKTSLLDPKILGRAVAASFQKLDPRVQLRNPVMFAVYLGSILTTVLWVNSLGSTATESSGFILGVAIWLWFTVLFANFAEAIAEGHGKAQAAALRKSRTQVIARKLTDRNKRITAEVSVTDLKLGDLVIVKTGDPWRFDDVQHRQRCRQVFRHSPGGVRCDLSGPQGVGPDAVVVAVERDPVCCDL